MERYRIVIIGSGNVASHIAAAFDAVADVVQVYSRTHAHALCLASRLRACEAVSSLSSIVTDADFYIISVADDAVTRLAGDMPDVKGVVVHTSGSIGIEALSSASAYGVFYPLQTFSRDTFVDVSRVPFFTEADSPETLQVIDSMVRLLGAVPHHADSAQRAVLHVAAVFACNFANHLWTISNDILAGGGFSLDVLAPLLEVTLDKALKFNPSEVQTGPAARGDVGVMSKHEASLHGTNLEIYRLLSKSIMQKKPTITQKKNTNDEPDRL